MKVTINSTSKIVRLKSALLLDGIPARVWEGETESGIKVHCFITRIGIDKNEPRYLEFEQELIACQEPTPEIDLYPKVLIL